MVQSLTACRPLPLAATHERDGARLVPFAGYQMPIQYRSGMAAEHRHTRQQVSLFDVSHMGQLLLIPRDGREETLHEQLESLFPIDFEGWPVGLQKYSYLLNQAGGIVDDLMLTRVANQEALQREAPQVRMVVNAANRQVCWNILQDACPNLDIRWDNAVLLALQGPLAEEVLCESHPSASDLRFMRSAWLNETGAWAVRSGYTGEDGYELSLPDAQAAEPLVERLLAHPAVAWAGLGARDTLRLEAGLALHGKDISPLVTPVSAGLSFAIAPSRRLGGKKAGGFPGADVLLAMMQQGPEKSLIGLVSEGVVPIRSGAPIVNAHDQVVGEVTSGTVSPTLGRPIMLAYVDVSALKAPIYALVRHHRLSVAQAALPFVPKRYRR